MEKRAVSYCNKEKKKRQGTGKDYIWMFKCNWSQLLVRHITLYVSDYIMSGLQQCADVHALSKRWLWGGTDSQRGRQTGVQSKSGRKRGNQADSVSRERSGERRRIKAFVEPVQREQTCPCSLLAVRTACGHSARPLSTKMNSCLREILGYSSGRQTCAVKCVVVYNLTDCWRCDVHSQLVIFAPGSAPDC